MVEAEPSDWERDPFTPVIEKGLLYGRGASDMKLDDALAVTALVELNVDGTGGQLDSAGKPPTADPGSIATL